MDLSLAQTQKIMYNKGKTDADFVQSVESVPERKASPMYAKVTSAGLFGMNAFLVEVETDISRGMPRFETVGLPDAAVKESRDRVKAALKNTGFEVPAAKITVNLAPADMHKSGPIYDLPIYLSLLSASGSTQARFDEAVFLGELALDGSVRRITGALPMTIMALEKGYKRIFLPAENAAEASVVRGIEVYGVRSALDVVNFYEGLTTLTPEQPLEFRPALEGTYPDMADVLGQETAKRALEIAAAGGHNTLLIGSPGSGKSMLAMRFPSILPDLTFEEAIETTKIHSIAGILTAEHPIITERPFRSPHHTVSPAGLSGGGTIPRPGEISLAHNGVLFLDELPEFDRMALEILRQPIEDGEVTISRVNGTLTYPCRMIVLAAMNPCPCGYYGHPTHACTCSPQKVERYLSRISGPLLDRIDLHVEVPPVEFSQLSGGARGETSSEIRKRVNRARKIQLERYQGTGVYCNSGLTPALMQKACPVSDKGIALLRSAFDRLGLSARGYNRILKVSRTIADLAGDEVIGPEHISEAVRFRSLDRKYWKK